MRKKVDDPRLMIKVCDLYYNQNASRQEIGQELGLSRPTIARLLDSAREQGLVRIEIPDLDTIAYWELEKKLEEKYGLRQVLVVDGSDDKDTLESALGSSAARYLQYVIKDDSIVGVSMGSTLHHMVSALQKAPAERVTYVPLVGGMGRLRMELHANSLAEKMSRLGDGTFTPLHAPARVSSTLVRDELMKEESVQDAVKLMNRIDVALVGIGYPNEHSAIKATGYYKENEIESLVSRKAAGELCMQFYDIEGYTEPYASDNAVIGMDIHRLCKVPCSVGIAGGKEKLSAIQGAINGKYINVLITDTECARALLSDEEEE